jgi:tyrosine-protein kinase Etk/Wzc
MSQSNQPVDAGSAYSAELDIASILDVLLDNRLLIAAVTSVLVVLGALYALLAAPIYESNITIQIEDNRDTSAAKSLLGDVSAMFEIKSSGDAEIQILGSRLVVSRTVDALKLNISAKPHRFPLIGNFIASRQRGLPKPGLLGFGGYAWGQEKIDVDSFDVPKVFEGKRFKLIVLPEGSYELEGPGLERPFVGVVGVGHDFATPEGSINLLVKHIDGAPGARFDLVRSSRTDTIEDLQRQLRIVELGKQSGVISATMRERDPVLLGTTLNELGAQYVRQNVDRKEAQAESSMRFLDGQEPVMKRELEEAEDRYNDYRNTHAIVDLGEEAKSIIAQSSDAQTAVFALRQKRQELMLRFGSQHPSIVALDEQIGAAQEQLSSLNERVKRMPTEERDALRLQRDVQVNSDLYLALRNNMEQLRLIKAGKIGSVRLVDTASVPERPVLPKKSLVIAVSALLGLFIGIAAAFIREKLFVGVTDVHALETHTGLAVAAMVPYCKEQRRLAPNQLSVVDGEERVLARVNPGMPTVESLRSLRTALQFAMLESPNNIVVLTGPTPGIGKSFVSVNLAAVLAENRRVLLIDGDMRRGYLNKYFGIDRSNGMADVIAGKCSVVDAIRKTGDANLDFVPTGAIPSNPAAMLLNKNWTAFIDQVAANYDIVLVDAPPVLAVTDAAIMASAAGTIFMVTRFAQTRIGEVVESVKQLSQSGSRVSGLIFNGVKQRGGRYNYGGKYGSYRYTRYYYDDK